MLAFQIADRRICENGRDRESINEITEKNNQLYLTTPLGVEYLAKGNISNLRTDPSPLLKELGIKKADRTNLRNIYFDFDKANLDRQDITYLNEVKNILKHDTSLKLVVAGHADDRGDDHQQQHGARK